MQAYVKQVLKSVRNINFYTTKTIRILDFAESYITTLELPWPKEFVEEILVSQWHKTDINES